MGIGLTWVDTTIILLYLAASLGIGLYYRRRAQQGVGAFFLGGRSFPGWLAGLSMVATTFAADTPLAVTELVRSGGIAGNWLWWNMLLGGMFTTFFFARLWRRSGLSTDLELIQIRYSGPAAQALRRIKAVYLGLGLNTLILAWVHLAMVAILQVFFGLSAAEALLATAGVLLLTTFYTSLSGLWGVVVTDAFQFVLAMSGCIVLAVWVLDAPAIGGLTGLVTQLEARHPAALAFLPQIGPAPDAGTGEGLVLGLGAFLTMVGLQWWASWYPGAEPGGGGYVAQRMLAARDEQAAQDASLIFQLLHYALRPWPWILVGLACLLLYPELGPADAKLGYLYAMRDYLPPGWRGLLLAGFLAAYMSTASSQMNWGASYLVNDLYLPSRRRTPSARATLRVSQLAQVLLALLSLGLTTQLESIQEAWVFLLQCGAGVGFVLIARWFWWRISAWSEIAATLTPFLVLGAIALLRSLGYQGYMMDYPGSMVLTTCLSVGAALLAAGWLPGTSAATLRAFCERLAPPGWWGPYRPKVQQGPQHPNRDVPRQLLQWALGVGLVYGLLFTTGALLLGRSGQSLGLLLPALACGAGLYCLQSPRVPKTMEAK